MDKPRVYGHPKSSLWVLMLLNSKWYEKPEGQCSIYKVWMQKYMHSGTKILVLLKAQISLELGETFSLDSEVLVYIIY